MRKILLHCGLHKTGSTWLQVDVFPHWDGIEYLGKDAIREESLSQEDSKPLVISNESLAGYPYPITNGFDISVISGNIKKYKATHVLVVEREFFSWCLSIYMQTINEGHFWSLDEFLDKNKNIISWRDCVEEISRECERMNVEFLSIGFEDLRKDAQKAINKISIFLDVSTLVAPVSARNSSRYGIFYINSFRLLNYLFRGRVRHKLGIRPMMQRNWVGGVLDSISIKKLSSSVVEDYFERLNLKGVR